MAQAATLDDKYILDEGKVYLTGVQALVRLPMMQKRFDEANGINSACFISGYRGSPLAGFDMALWKAKKFIQKHNIHFQPGVNEDLGATAVWGSQQANLFQGAKFDGVFSIWYGKGPGVDRSGDVFKHANAAGTSKHGGVLLFVGDDHSCKSSTYPHQSEFALIDAMIPIFNPSNVQDYLDLGLYGWALSRYSGLWVAFKTIAETVDSTASVYVDPKRTHIITPSDFEIPKAGLNIRWPDPPLDQEFRLHNYKIPAALAFARANMLDKTIIESSASLGIITTGKSYIDVLQALDDLGITHKMASDIGIRLYKISMSWPVEPEGILRFSKGLKEILVVEEKRSVIEYQIKDILYNRLHQNAPLIVGKTDQDGSPLLPSTYELNSAMISKVIVKRLSPFFSNETINNRLALIERQEKLSYPTSIARVPFYCSGCPHNTSTTVPEGSMALGGIGCHYMATWMGRGTMTFTQMGGEGASWIGQAPFTSTEHVFQNLGDGTYFHSGILGIRATIAAKVNITYKILYNDAVAMTGGQPVDGQLTVPQITQQVYAEGVRRIAVVSEDPSKYPVGLDFAKSVTFHHRDEMKHLQEELRQYQGVSVIVYDQTCAAEKRRRRKRGLEFDPSKRIFINDRVCEGCGDCGVQSNCLSVVQKNTVFGIKRAIDQSSCNKDYSCVKGHCPSFISIIGGEPRTVVVNAKDNSLKELPFPKIPTLDKPFNILITGVGGTGVVTIGAILGMAAHLENKGCNALDMTGLAQKGGPVLSHVRIANKPEDIHSMRIGIGAAHLLLGCDLVVSASKEVLPTILFGQTHAVINTQEVQTADFVNNPNAVFPGYELREIIQKTAGKDQVDFVNASRLATALIGDSIATNLFMLGYAFQKGYIPLSSASIEEAIRLNEVSVAKNLETFLWGRRAAHDLAAIEKMVKTVSEEPQTYPSFNELADLRYHELVNYQNTAYAERHKKLVEQVQQAESSKTIGKTGLAQSVSKYYHKLLAYKDEYEIARLHSSKEFFEQISQQFEGNYSIEFNLSPPMFVKPDPKTGTAPKWKIPSWLALILFGLLAKLKFLRGTIFDIFGYMADRKFERHLITEYENTIEELIEKLDYDNHSIAVQIAEIPEFIRGYGHVKMKHYREAKAKEKELLELFRKPKPESIAA